jgi:hypothetical protein
MSIIFIKEVIFMPKKDGTGPQGKGPKTGRGLGNCTKKEQKKNKKNK